MVDTKDMTPKQMYYAIQEDRMSSADFEEWLDKQVGDGWSDGYDEGYCEGTDQGTFC